MINNIAHIRVYNRGVYGWITAIHEGYAYMSSNPEDAKEFPLGQAVAEVDMANRHTQSRGIPPSRVRAELVTAHLPVEIQKLMLGQRA